MQRTLLALLLCCCFHSRAQLITTFAGADTIMGFSGNGIPALHARFMHPAQIITDTAGDLYIADANNNQVRKITLSTGMISLIAGDTASGYSGDGGLADTARMKLPTGLAFDISGNLYIAANNIIRKVDAHTGIITRVAGCDTVTSPNNGGLATLAQLNQAFSVAVDSAYNIYIAESQGNIIRKVTASTGIINPFIGTGGTATSYNVPALSAQFYAPQYLLIGDSGNIYFSTGDNHVFKYCKKNGYVFNYAGNGGVGCCDDNTPAVSAYVNSPQGLLQDKQGNMLIAVAGTETIRRVDTNGIITTLAGVMDSAGFTGDGGPCSRAKFDIPSGLAMGKQGELYISDMYNNCIRKISCAFPSYTGLNCSATPAAVCAGGPLVLHGNAGTTYTWSGNIQNDTAFYPLSDNRYYLIGVNTTGQCDTSSIFVPVHRLPLPTIYSTKQNFCNAVVDTLLTDSFRVYNWAGHGTKRMCVVTSPGSYTLTVQDSNSCSNSASITITDSCNYVWPGDANNDLVADINDVLNIGIANGTAGLVRNSASLTWTGQPCADWPYAFSDGTNYKYSDCNGDGTIDLNDTLGILQNYSLVHASRAPFRGSSITPDGIPLYLVAQHDSVAPGQVGVFNIMLGTAAAPANGVYGLTFELNCDAAVVEAGSVGVNGSGSWMGTAGTNLLTLAKVQGVTAHVAVCKTDQFNASGQGKIGELYFRFKPTVASGTTASFSFSAFNLIDVSQTPFAVHIPQANPAVWVWGTNTGILNPGTPVHAVQVFPNPAQGLFTIKTEDYAGASLEVYDATGKRIAGLLLTREVTPVDLSMYPDGLYQILIRKNGSCWYTARTCKVH